MFLWQRSITLIRNMQRKTKSLSTTSRKSKHGACHLKLFVASIYLSITCEILLLEIIKENKTAKIQNVLSVPSGFIKHHKLSIHRLRDFVTCIYTHIESNHKQHIILLVSKQSIFDNITTLKRESNLSVYALAQALLHVAADTKTIN